MKSRKELIKILDLIDRTTKHIRDRLDTLNTETLEEEISSIPSQIKFMLYED